MASTTRSVIDALLKGLGDIANAENIGGLANQAKHTWDSQSPMVKGAVAGALVTALLTRDGRRVLGAGAGAGGAALVAMLALKAWRNWKAGAALGAAGDEVLPDPLGTSFLPADPEAAADLSHRLLQAMVAAVKADGTVTDAERAAVNAEVEKLKMAGGTATDIIAQEMNAAPDPGRIANLAHSPEEAAAIYTASALVVDRNAPAEQGYLTMLAARLGLDKDLVAHLDASVAAAAA